MIAQLTYEESQEFGEICLGLLEADAIEKLKKSHPLWDAHEKFIRRKIAEIRHYEPSWAFDPKYIEENYDTKYKRFAELLYQHASEDIKTYLVLKWGTIEADK